MEFHLLPIFTFLYLALVTSHAALPSEVYWKSVLPNTPMPKAFKDLLLPESLEEKFTSVGVRKSGVDIGKGDVEGSRITLGYNNAAAEELDAIPKVVLFFMEKDMHHGTNMKLHFIKTTSTATFLPRQVAESIPFSSSQFPQILSKFAVKPNSIEAEIMKKTIKRCENPKINGEEKYCATSLESMIDFSISELGKKVRAISIEVQKETQLQSYSIVGVKKMRGDKSVVCHKQNYAYVVFYCHKTDNTKAYAVSLVGENGTKVKAVAVCHTDTSAWNPKHLAFQVLKVKPGTVPICHFIPEDHVVWVPY